MPSEEAKRRAREQLVREQEADDYLQVLRGGDEAADVLANRAKALEAGDYAPGDLRIEGSEIRTKDGRVVWPTPQTQESVRSRIGEMAAANPESVSIGTRAGRSVKMSPTSAREYTQAATGSAVIDTPEGEAVIEGGKPKLVDPSSVGSTLGILGSLSGFGTILLGPYAPLVAAAIEYKKPGATVEAGKDIADISGEAIEAGPEVVGELLMRRGGVGAIKRVPAQAGLAAAGTTVRRGISETLPGEDISLEDTLRRAGTNAALSGAAEVPALAGAELIPTPGGMPTKPERMLGKTLRGAGSPASEREASRLSQKAGVDFLPAEQTLDANALGFTDTLRNNPGIAERYMAHDVANINAASRFTQKRLDALLGSSLPQKDVANKVHATTKGYYDKLDDIRKANFQRTLAPYEDMPFVTYNSDELAKEMSGMGIEIPQSKDVMTVKQFQAKLHQATEMARGNMPLLKADRDTSMWVGQRWKESLLKDLESPDPSMAEAADALKEARAGYYADSRPLDDARLDVIQKILRMKQKKNLEQLPDVLLGNTVSDEQVGVLFDVLNKDDSATAMRLRRNMVDAVLSGTEAERANTPILIRAAEEGAAKGITARNPRQVATAIMDNRRRLAAAIGDEGVMAELDGIAKLFNRISSDKSVGSKTAMRGWWERILSPAQTAGEVGRWAFKSRLTDMLLDPKRRAVLVGLSKKPQNVLARTAATTLQQLAAMEAYGAITSEEEPEE